MTAPLIAILIDDDPEEAKAFKPIWEAILSSVWPEVQIRLQSNFEDHDIFKETRPHVAIVDNVLMGKNREIDNKGLEVISVIKKQFPDTLFILHTSKTFTIEGLGFRFPNPDIIVTKQPLPNGPYQDEIADQIRHRISRFPIAQVSFSNPRDINDTSIDRITAQSLVEQCALSFQSFRQDFGQDFQGVDQVHLSPLGGGRSGAGVFKCEIYRKDGGTNSQFVFKYSDLESISREVDNYHRYVRLQIPHHIRVDLVGVGQTTEIGAAMYGFAFGQANLVSSLTEQLLAGNSNGLGHQLINWIHESLAA